MNKLYTLIILAWGVGVSPRLFASDSIRENVQTRSEFNLSQDKRRHARKSYLVDMLSIGGACLTFLVTYVGYRKFCKSMNQYKETLI